MNFLGRQVLRVSDRFRRRRLERFRDIMDVGPGDRILDVGGLPALWQGSGFERNVTLLNLSVPEDGPGPFTWTRGDGCDMRQFPDRSFDIVFSNSVIEHVGALEKQRQMASEVRRVARKYWIQTPNRSFPLEAHFLFPFFQYLPRRARMAVAHAWPFSFAKIYRLDPTFEADHIWLLSARELGDLFPDGTLLRERAAGLTKSLIAFRK